MQTEFVTGAEITQRLHVKLRSLKRLAALGRFPAPAHQLGRVVLWHRADWERFLRGSQGAAGDSGAAPMTMTP